MTEETQPASLTRTFKRGAIGFLDALGFKGIWRETRNPTDVLELLGEVHREVTDSAGFVNDVFSVLSRPGGAFLERRVMFISDSVFIAVWRNMQEGHSPLPGQIAPLDDAGASCVRACSQMCQGLAVAAARRSSLLRYRGVVTYGDFDVHPEQNFVVGPAVDEVASLEREAEGAFIWLTPRAAAFLREPKDDEPLGLMPRYHVPFKGGRSLYRPGELVLVRHRQYLVEAVHRPEAHDEMTRIEMVCLDDDNQGRKLEVLWELELGARRLDPATRGLGQLNGLDPPRHFAAYLHAIKWTCVTATNARLFQAPFRAGIQILNHQLAPLRKALDLPRANLFIADDVGLGKTVEAGLVIQELILRQRLDFLLVVVPASITLQWRTEMERRFGLQFEIYNREFVARRRRERGTGHSAHVYFQHSREAKVRCCDSLRRVPQAPRRADFSARRSRCWAYSRRSLFLYSDDA